MIKFYFIKGIRFWNWHDKITRVVNLEIGPVGAPLGEEITKREEFKEVFFKVSLSLEEDGDFLQGSCTLSALRESKWNEENDSLIHGFSIFIPELDFNPGIYGRWPQHLALARALYRQTKMIFLSFDCDAAEGETYEYQRAFCFLKGASVQDVIVPFEEVRDTTLEESHKWTWMGQLPTGEVFK